MESQFVWKNGTILPWKDATVHISSHGLHYGTGVFEGIRCYPTNRGPAVFRMGAHLDRLFASAQVYGMALRYTRQDLARGILDVIRANQFSDCYVRPVAFYGSRSLSLNPSQCPVEVAILAWPWQPYLANERGTIHATFSRWRKFSPAAMPATAKACGQYLNSVLATQEASTGGFDEAILLNEDGTIAEGAGENLFVVRDGQLVTNDATSSVLLGITRDSVLKAARRLELPIQVRELTVDDLLTADEAFFTGTATEIAPIAAVDREPIGTGAPGPITLLVQRTYADIVHGKEPYYSDWLTFVPGTSTEGACRHEPPL